MERPELPAEVLHYHPNPNGIVCGAVKEYGRACARWALEKVLKHKFEFEYGDGQAVDVQDIRALLEEESDGA